MTLGEALTQVMQLILDVSVEALVETVINICIVTLTVYVPLGLIIGLGFIVFQRVTSKSLKALVLALTVLGILTVMAMFEQIGDPLFEVITLDLF